jgi:hypothetical protein
MLDELVDQLLAWAEAAGVELLGPDELLPVAGRTAAPMSFCSVNLSGSAADKVARADREARAAPTVRPSRGTRQVKDRYIGGPSQVSGSR